MNRLLESLPRAALEAVLAPFGEELTLPAAAYTSPDVFDWERSHIWDGGWVAIGRHHDFPAGSVTEVTVGNESLVVTGGEDLGVFFNVCRHRGHELLTAGEHRRSTSLRCPYHGWVYGLEGALRAAPKMHHRSDLDGIALVPAPVSVWQGWVMVAIDPAAGPLDAAVGDLGELIEPYHPASLVSLVRRSYTVDANWKLIHENYHECYHCPSIHPQLTAVALTDSGDNWSGTGTWVGGTLGLREGFETLSLDGTSGGCRIAGLADDRTGEAVYVGLVPNLLISLHPDYVITHRLEAVAADRTLVHCEWLFPAAAAQDPGFDPAYAVEFWDVTNRQDWAACASLQRGAGSHGYRPGRLSAGEDAVYQFLGMIANSYLGNGLAAVPNPGRR